MNLLTSNSARNAAGEVGNFGLENGGFSDGASLGNGDGGFGPNTNLDNAFTDFSSDPAVVEAFGNIPNFAAAANSLSEKGFSVEPETGAVTLPNGKTLSPKEVQKAVGRALKDPKLQAFQKTLAKKRKKYLNRISRFRAGGGGGYKSTSARRGDKANAKRPGYNFNFGNKKGSRSIASVPGKVKMVNGDPLGAASDNVFHIVERAYQGLVTSKVLQEKVPKLGK